MAKTPLELRGVEDPRTLAAMHKVERDRFVPEEIRGAAYEDRALPIGHGQTISQPYVVALMSQLLGLRGHERVLEIGTGSGYQAAVLGELAAEVYTVEIVPDLSRRAAALLKEMGYSRIHVREGDGARGWPEAAPFGAIMVTCAPDHLPQALIDQLEEGGRLVVPIGPALRAQTLYRFEKVKGAMVQRPVIPVSFVPMTGESR